MRSTHLIVVFLGRGLRKVEKPEVQGEEERERGEEGESEKREKREKKEERGFRKSVQLQSHEGREEGEGGTRQPGKRGVRDTSLRVCQCGVDDPWTRPDI
jgi:hypothetical protein